MAAIINFAVKLNLAATDPVQPIESLLSHQSNERELT